MKYTALMASFLLLTIIIDTVVNVIAVLKHDCCCAQIVLAEHRYEYILERACVQFEPDDPNYIRVWKEFCFQL